METKYSVVRGMLRGTLVALCATLFFVLVLALVVRFSGIGGGTIGVITQIIKIASIFWGVSIVVSVVEKRGWLWGIVLGVLYTALTYFAFSIIGGDGFSITTGIFADILFASVVGLLSAMFIRMTRREV